MIEKINVLDKIVKKGVVAIIRLDSEKQIYEVVDACFKGGIEAIEVTFTINIAGKIIEKINEKFPDCLIGAGSVLDPETARIAILSGAKYIVSPSFNKNTAKLCNRYAIPYLAGCSTPKEIELAMEYGVDIIKLFPAENFNPSIVKALKGPFPQVNLMATGGVNLENTADWIKAGAVAVGVGSNLTGIVDAEETTAKAKKYIQIVSEARNQ